MRLFLAIELPDSVKQHLARVQEGFCDSHGLAASVRRTRHENLHITVKFIGEIAENKLPVISRALRAVEVAPMMLFCDRMIYLPPRGPVRIVSVGIGGDTGRLNQLASAIEAALEPVGIPRERRAYIAHITIARSRHGARGSDVSSLRMDLPGLFPGPTFEANSFTLMKSDLAPDGPHYLPLETFR